MNINFNVIKDLDNNKIYAFAYIHDGKQLIIENIIDENKKDDIDYIEKVEVEVSKCIVEMLVKMYNSYNKNIYWLAISSGHTIIEDKSDFKVLMK